MRFPSLKNSSSSFHRVIKLDGGLDTSVAPMLLAQNGLCDCSNMIFSDSMLKTRDGVFASADSVIKRLSYLEENVKPFIFTEQSFVIEERECVLGYSVTGDNSTYYSVNVYLFYPDMTYKSLGTVRFGRADSTNFFKPQKLTFFKAKGTKGAGLYLFCESINIESSAGETDYRIYEADTDFTEWIRLSESDLYIPTVYYNGKGNLFSESIVADSDAYEKAVELESQNLLTGYFYSYFSTDGSSDTFQLPFTDLDDVTVVCSLSYKNGDSYVWKITDEEEEIDFLTTKVTAKCNRKKGTVTFYQNGQLYPVPLLVRGSINNLKILAKKTVPDGHKSVVSSSGAFLYKSNILLYGNSIVPNSVFMCPIKNPLYFPKGSNVELGDTDSEVTALKTIGSTLIAFKADEIHTLKTTEGRLISSIELISGITNDFYKPDKIEYSPINGSIGCRNSKSLSHVGEYLVWKGYYKIYAMNSSGRIYSISYPISAQAEETENKANCFSFVYNGFYAININDTLYLGDIKNASVEGSKLEVAWYMWKLPQETQLTSATDFEGNPLLSFFDPDRFLHYTAQFKGEKDIVMFIDDNRVVSTQNSIDSYFKTAFFDTDAIKLEAITLDVGSKGEIEIEVDTHNSKLRFLKEIGLTENEADNKIFKKITVYPSLKTERASIKVKGESPFYLNNFKFFYR